MSKRTYFSPYCLLYALIGVAVSDGCVMAASFERLIQPAFPAIQSRTAGVSFDGSAIVGTVDTGQGALPFLWTEGAGMTLLSTPAGSEVGAANGVADSAALIVGYRDTMAGPEAFYKSSRGSIIGIDDLANGQFSSEAVGISSNGQVIAGTGHSDFGSEAFRSASPFGSLQGLGFLPNGISSYATNISADGSTIVGASATFSAIGGEAFRWTQAGGMVGLGDLPGGGVESVAYATSANGAFTVGSGTTDTGVEAVRWFGGGIASLGDLPGGAVHSVARAVSGTGAVIVGEGATAGANTEAFIWRPGHGIQALHDVLSTDFGLAAELEGWDLLSATGISGDGSVIAGAGIGPTGEFEAWRAVLDPSTELPADYNDDGIVDAADYTRWRDALGGTAGLLENNINGGPISTAHYDTWKDIFGAASTGSASFASTPTVPEPHSATLLALQLAGLFWIARKTRQSRTMVPIVS